MITRISPWGNPATIFWEPVTWNAGPFILLDAASNLYAVGSSQTVISYSGMLRIATEFPPSGSWYQEDFLKPRNFPPAGLGIKKIS
jgi:hypothetical protein